jgi:hypothetical protein
MIALLAYPAPAAKGEEVFTAGAGPISPSRLLIRLWIRVLIGLLLAKGDIRFRCRVGSLLCWGPNQGRGDEVEAGRGKEIGKEEEEEGQESTSWETSS